MRNVNVCFSYYALPILMQLASVHGVDCCCTIIIGEHHLILAHITAEHIEDAERRTWFFSEFNFFSEFKCLKFFWIKQLFYTLCPTPPPTGYDIDLNKIIEVF